MTDTLAQDIVEGRRQPPESCRETVVQFPEGTKLVISHDAFLRILECFLNPPEANLALRDLMRKPTVWGDDPHAPDAHTFGG